MRKLILLCLGLAVIYSAYWFIAANASERGIKAWLDARETDGWQSEYTALETRGYPLHLKTVLADIAMADPATGLAYQTSRLTIESRSFTPTRLHASMAQDARVSTPFQHIDITNSRAEGTLFVAVGPALTLQRAAFEFDALTAASTLGWGFSLANAKAVAIQNAQTALAHDIAVTITDFTPSASLMSRLNPNGILSDSFDALTIDGQVTFDKAWDITALEGPRPQPTKVHMRNMAATWGALDLRIAGAFDVDARGFPNGKLSIKATNWREMITLATAAGIIPKDLENLALRAGNMLAGMKGNTTTIDAELTLARGTISFGFLPLGPAPRLKIR
jgi:hypothetical protein